MGFKRFVLYSPRDQKIRIDRNTTAQSAPQRGSPTVKVTTTPTSSLAQEQIHSHAIPSEHPDLATDGDMKASDDVLDDM